MTADLITRLKNAKGPDRELDLAIARALAPNVIVLLHNAETKTNEPHVHWRYTGSIDAAAFLVAAKMETHSLIITIDPSGNVAKLSWFPDGLAGEAEFGPYEAVAATPAIAILIALFDALSTEDDDD